MFNCWAACLVEFLGLRTKPLLNLFLSVIGHLLWLFPLMQPAPLNRLYHLQMDTFVRGSVPDSVRNVLSAATKSVSSWYQNTHAALVTVSTTAVLAPLVSTAGN